MWAKEGNRQYISAFVVANIYQLFSKYHSNLWQKGMKQMNCRIAINYSSFSFCLWNVNWRPFRVNNFSPNHMKQLWDPVLNLWSKVLNLLCNTMFLELCNFASVGWNEAHLHSIENLRCLILTKFIYFWHRQILPYLTNMF